jgi:hypothetical protein
MNDYSFAIPPQLKPLGFSLNPTGGHMARSMMLEELNLLAGHAPLEATLEDFRKAVLEENVLGKSTYSSRAKSLRHLTQLYGLDREMALFAALRYLGRAEPSALPLVALVCAFCRDPQLRQSFALVDRLPPGTCYSRLEMESHLEKCFPERFSVKMKKSLAQNVSTTWTVTGHLKGRVAKVRATPAAHPAATVYAMFAGYLFGLRGTTLVQSVFGRLVAPEPTGLLQHLAQGSARGWLRFRHAGGVMETDFTPLMTWINHEKDLAYVTH